MPETTPMMIAVVGTPDLPESIREKYEGRLFQAHEMVTDHGVVIGYRVAFLELGLPHLANIILVTGPPNDEWDEDDCQLMDGWPNTTVPCRRDFHVCSECLHEIRARAYVIEGEGWEDRPMPSVMDAWNCVVDNEFLCGGDHCENLPQRVIWTKTDGSVDVRVFGSTADASEYISGIVQWAEEIVGLTSVGELTPDEIIDLYENLDTRPLGSFVRQGIDPLSGELLP